MVLALEIGMFIYGIIILAKGKVSLANNRLVTGTPARVIGVIALLTLPVILAVSFAIGFMIGISNPGFDFRRNQWLFVVLVIGLLAMSGIIMMLISRAYAASDPGVAAWRQYEWDTRQIGAPQSGYGPDGLAAPPPVLIPAAYPPVPCTACGSLLQVGPEWAGKQIRCSKCQTILTAPELPRSTDAITQRPQTGPR